MMFVKLTSGFAGIPLVSRNVVLQELWRTGSKSCKLEVTFAIHQDYIILVGKDNLFAHPNLLIIDSPRKNLGAQAADEEFRDEKIFNATIKYLYEKAEQYKDEMQVIVVNNGHPSFIPSECVVAEFDSDGRDGLPIGLIDDAL